MPARRSNANSALPRPSLPLAARLCGMLPADFWIQGTRDHEEDSKQIEAPQGLVENVRLGEVK